MKKYLLFVKDKELQELHKTIELLQHQGAQLGLGNQTSSQDIFIFLNRLMKKKCELRLLVQNCTIFVQSHVWYFFNIFLNFFLVLQWPKKIRETFLLSKSEVQKSKNVYVILHFYQILILLIF